MQEWSTMFKVGVGIILLVLLVGVVFSLSYIGYDTANDSASQLSDQVSSLNQRIFDPYDQTQISGNMVLSTIKSFEGEEVAVIVKTNRNGVGQAVNYCAQLSGTGTGSTYSQAAFIPPETDPPVIGNLSTEDTVDGNDQNLNLANARMRTQDNYINPTGFFMSRLIYDANRVVVGIYIEQLGGSAGSILQ